MNQILVTQKLYVTPELRRKKKMYKIQFFLSVLLVCLLFSYYIYAEYDRSKSEEVSKEILSVLDSSGLQNEEKDNTIKAFDNMIVVALDDNEDDDNQIIQPTVEETTSNSTSTNASSTPSINYTSNSGVTYNVDARLNIPRLGINYPVLSECSEELLKISLNKYWGPKPNEVGNYCIVGHNYKSGKMFGKLSSITNGDVIELTDYSQTSGRTIKYEVYDTYVVKPDDTRCTSQITGGKKEITLITCKTYGQERLIVKAREIK